MDEGVGSQWRRGIRKRKQRVGGFCGQLERADVRLGTLKADPIPSTLVDFILTSSSLSLGGGTAQSCSRAERQGRR